MFRRFTRLRARLLLSKQDQLTLLENQLDKVDREEESPMFLGSSRLDRNAQRKEILSQIESKLQEYGAYSQLEKDIDSPGENTVLCMRGHYKTMILLIVIRRSCYKDTSNPIFKSSPATGCREPAKLDHQDRFYS